MDWVGLLFSAELARAGIRSATPLIGAAAGEIVAERSGSVNIGLEGMMLAGAFAGVVGSSWFHSAWAGFLVAAMTGGCIGLLLAFLILGLGADQIVAGTALNLLAGGITSYLNRAIFGQTPPPVASFDPLALPILHSIPLVGPLLFEQIPIVYLIYLITPLVGVWLYYTPWGLRIRAVGEQRQAAQSAGVPARKYQIWALAFCGVLASSAGTYYSLGNVRFFTENMTVGNGFIALAVVIVSRWNPFLVVPVSLVFGVASSVGLRAQAFQFPVPYEFLLMLPYALTLLVYGVFARGRERTRI